MSGEALTYVEIDIPYCALTYGVPPCQASLTSSPPTGTAKCQNTFFTCQDPANYTEETKTLRFAVATSHLPRDIDIIGPWVEDVDYSPSTVSLGENLGQRASVKIVLSERRHSDVGDGLDKYHDERGYDPYQQGTFWARLRARHPSLRGREIRIISGFVGDALADMETRHFWIESFDGPTPDGKFSITAKDALKFLDGDRAQAPVLSNGFLVASIDDNDTSATLSPAGIGNAEYSASGYVNIGGNEVCAFTRIADVLTITRAQFGTEASSHDDQDRVQLCLHYDADSPDIIIADLIENYTDLDVNYIDNAAWAAEVAAHLNRVYTTIITEPTSVAKLVSEVIEQAALALWDDNEAQQLRLQVLRGINTDADTFDESNVLPGSFSVSDQPDKRVSRVQVYFGIIDPTKRIDDRDNYRSTAEVIDEDAEEIYRSPAIKTIFSRWIPQGGRTHAERIAAILLSRYSTPPRKFSVGVFRGNVDTPQLGGGYRLQWWSLQNPDGSGEDVPTQLIRLNPSPARIQADLEEMRFDAADADLANRIVTIDFNTNNLNWKTAHDALYPAIESGQTATLKIDAGVIVGSTTTALPALDVGTWPAGVTLNLQVIGRVQGRGGNGGTASPPTNGHVGGPALYTREAINLDVDEGEIFGGGGGGGAGDAGGGGGAGQLPGNGGGGSAQPGTTEAGGAGSADAGAGGGPGLAGQNGDASNGAAAGAAIDGVSFVTVTQGPGDIRGGQIN